MSLRLILDPIRPSTHLSHIFLGSEHNFMIDHPLGLSVEQSATWMDVNHLGNVRMGGVRIQHKSVYQ